MVETRHSSLEQSSSTEQTNLDRLKETTTTASKRIVKSYGGMTETLQFFDPIERLKMQALSIWWYNIGVARV